MSEQAQGAAPQPNNGGEPNMLDAALAYAAQGIPVFPCWGTNGKGECECPKKRCGNAGKHPRTQHGFKNATSNTFEIRKWWRKWPTAPIGIRTGTVLVGLDADDGDDGLAEAIAYGVDANRLHDRSGNGRHFVFRVPDGIVLRNKGKGVGGWPFQHCDARGEGGYLVAAPSLHYTGRRYAWSEPFDLAAVPDVPPELLAVWRDPPDDPRNSTPLPDDADDDPDDEGEDGADSGQGEVSAEFFLRKYTRAALRGGADRNSTGFLLALQLRDAPLTLDAAIPYMRRYQEAVATCRPNKDAYTWAEAEESLRQAYSRVPRTPGLAGQPGNVFITPGELAWSVGWYLKQFGNQLRYVKTSDRWYVWNDKWWDPDEEQTAKRLGTEAVLRLYGQAAVETSDDKRAATVKLATKLDRAERVAAMVSHASAYPPISARIDQLDPNDWQVVAANGVIDLRTGRLLPHDPR